jgi:hypothetical protein
MLAKGWINGGFDVSILQFDVERLVLRGCNDG